MKVKKHPNYYILLLVAGAKIIEPFRFTGEAETKGKGRFWIASAKLRIGHVEIHLSAYFHGGLTETEEVVQANLNIHNIIMDHDVAGVTPRAYAREGFGLLLLNDGVYVNPNKTAEITAEVRKMCDYATAHYIGIPSAEERAKLEDLGYERVVAWP